MKVVKTIHIFILILLSSCCKFTPSSEEIIGTWKADDGAELIFRKNGTCSVKDINTQYVPINSNFDAERNIIDDSQRKGYSATIYIWEDDTIRNREYGLDTLVIPMNSKIADYKNTFNGYWRMGKFDNIEIYTSPDFNLSNKTDSCFATELNYLYEFQILPLNLVIYQIIDIEDWKLYKFHKID